MSDGNTGVGLQSHDAANVEEDIQQHWIGELDESYIVREEALSQVQNSQAARERVCDL